MCQTEWIHKPHRLITHKPIQVDSARFADGVSIQPPLQIGVIEPEAVVIQPAVRRKFLARKAVNVRVRQTTAGRNQVSVWVIPVTCRCTLAAVYQVGDVSASIRMIEIVRGPISSRISM